MEINIQITSATTEEQLIRISAAVLTLAGHKLNQAPNIRTALTPLPPAVASAAILDVPNATPPYFPQNVTTPPPPTTGPQFGAPPPAAAIPPQPPGGVGVRWDARIHSKEKQTNADGTYRRRRGVEDDVYNAVMAELQGGASAVPLAPLPPALVTTPPAPIAPPPPPAPPVAPAAQVENPAFAATMRAYTSHIKSDINPNGKLNDVDMNNAAIAIGFNGGVKDMQYATTEKMSEFITRLNSIITTRTNG